MDKGFNINIRYHGMDYLVKIEDPSEPLKDIIEKLAYNMGVPRYDRHNNPVTHSLERKVGTAEEALRTHVNGEDKSLLDYNVKPGDKLFFKIYGIGIAYGVYPVRIKKYKISWMDLIELKNLYAFFGVEVDEYQTSIDDSEMVFL